jgi:biotin carboxylase
LLFAHSQDEQPYIIEANPRASRTVPFVAKAVGHPIAKYASLLMAGKTLKDIGFTEVRCCWCYCCCYNMLRNMSRVTYRPTTWQQFWLAPKNAS